MAKPQYLSSLLGPEFFDKVIRAYPLSAETATFHTAIQHGPHEIVDRLLRGEPEVVADPEIMELRREVHRKWIQIRSRLGMPSRRAPCAPGFPDAFSQ